jgi:hypothetical protein
VLARGYGLATVYYGDIEPDFPEGGNLGLRAALSPQGKDTVFQPDDWGAIGVWAYGLSRAMDYLEQEPAVDAKRVAVMGHSRLGKTALWAGAQDERFAIVISNNSGEGGASLVRRRFGEAIHHSVSMVPYWYCTRYRQYAWHEADLPVDAHMLISLIAPRPVYVASATKDLWADPRGEFLAAKHAEPVYQLLGRAGLGVADMPPADHPVGDFIGYHVRTGDHDVTAYDWEQYIAFADRHFRQRVAGRSGPDAGNHHAGPHAFRWLLLVLRPQPTSHAGPRAQLVSVLGAELGKAACRAAVASRWHREPGVRARHGGVQSTGQPCGVGTIPKPASQRGDREGG